MLDNIETLLNVEDGRVLQVSPARVEENVPSSFKLLKKKNGEYVLMGAFKWWQGLEGGIKWKELPTEFE